MTTFQPSYGPVPASLAGAPGVTRPNAENQSGPARATPYGAKPSGPSSRLETLHKSAGGCVLALCCASSDEQLAARKQATMTHATGKPKLRPSPLNGEREIGKLIR